MLLLFNIIFIYMSKIIGMVSEDRRGRLRLQPTSETEAPSPIFTVALAESLENPALAGPNETGLSEVDLSGIIIFFI